MDSDVPNNVLENGRQRGRSQSEYNEVSHFKNTDPIPKNQPNVITKPIDNRDMEDDLTTNY